VTARAVAREDEPLAIGRKHREAVESRGVGDPLRLAAVAPDSIEIELPL